MKIHHPRAEWRQRAAGWGARPFPSSNAVAKISPVGRPRTWESANATYKGFFSPSESLAVKQFPANNWADMDQSRQRARIIAADGSKTRAACSPILTWAAFAHQQSSWQSDSWWTPATATKWKSLQCTGPQWYVTPWMFKKIGSWDFSREEVVYK